ncbi:MAG: hypothetical protein KGL39_11565 [Patescibacteria group bacterium]|nr:hypothetical protein [Patescibacteria group bacterium]
MTRGNRSAAEEQRDRAMVYSAEAGGSVRECALDPKRLRAIDAQIDRVHWRQLELMERAGSCVLSCALPSAAEMADAVVGEAECLR